MASTRQRTGESSTGAEVASLAPIQSSADLDVVGRLQTLAAEPPRNRRERRRQAAELNRIVRRLHEALPPREAADTLLSLLASGTLSDRWDESGVSSRAVVVEQLLNYGYPYALEVPPEELAWLRSQQRRGGPARLLTMLSVAAVAVGAPLARFLELAHVPSWALAAACLHVVGVLVALYGMYRSAPGSPKSERFRGWLLGLGVLGVLCLLVPGQMTLASGVVAAVASGALRPDTPPPPQKNTGE